MADGTLNYFDRLFNTDPALLDRLYSGLQRRGVQEDKIPVALSYILEESGGDPRRSDKYGRGLVDGIDYEDNMFIDDDDSLIESQLDSIYDGVSSGRIDLDVDPGMTAYGSMLQYGYGGKLFAEGGPYSAGYSDEYPIDTALDSVSSGQHQGIAFQFDDFGHSVYAPNHATNRQSLDNHTTVGPTSWHPSDSMLNYLKGIEQFRGEWYNDGNGIPTIGYGFTGEDMQRLYPNGMTMAVADSLFDKEIEKRIPMFIQATPNFEKMNDNQRNALFSYYYNIGHGAYTTKSPKMQKAMAEEDWDNVMRNIDAGMNDSKNPGLKIRRLYEQALFSRKPKNEDASVSPVQSEKAPVLFYDPKGLMWHPGGTAPDSSAERERYNTDLEYRESVKSRIK